jgi:Fe-S cluster assembly ATPase SufC
VLYRHPAVIAAAVVAKPDEKWGEVPAPSSSSRPARVHSEPRSSSTAAAPGALQGAQAVVFGAAQDLDRQDPEVRAARAGFADTVTVEMPYGRKRALEIATTLALEPELMLLDEPTQGMGHEDVGRVVELIKKVSANRTILMVEHNLSVVETLCDRITVLQRGSVLAEGDYATVSKTRACWKPM